MSNATEVAGAVMPATEPSTEPSAEQPEPVQAATANAGESADDVGEADGAADLDAQDVDAELEEMKQRLAQMEAESAGMEGDAAAAVGVGAKAQNGATPALGEDAGAAAGTSIAGVEAPARIPLSTDVSADADGRSIYVGNVDYSATGDQLSGHFADCGTINRVTIMCDKATRQPKGYAYIEFEEHDAAQNALILNESTFLGRELKVVPKRTNIPGVYRGRYPRGRGRFARGGRGYPRRGRRSWRGRWSPY